MWKDIGIIISQISPFCIKIKILARCILIKFKQIHFPIPACTRSPFCSSDIVTDFPFSRETLAVEGRSHWLHSYSKSSFHLSVLLNMHIHTSSRTLLFSKAKAKAQQYNNNNLIIIIIYFLSNKCRLFVFCSDCSAPLSVNL